MGSGSSFVGRAAELALLAAQPATGLVLMFDDVHWADENINVTDR